MAEQQAGHALAAVGGGGIDEVQFGFVEDGLPHDEPGQLAALFGQQHGFVGVADAGGKLLFRPR